MTSTLKLDEVDIDARALKLAESQIRNDAVLRRAREIRASIDHLPSEPVEGLEKLDDAVKASDDFELRLRRLRSVARSATRLVDELLDLLRVHGSPSVGVSESAGSVDVSEPIVGAAPGACSSGAPGATPAHRYAVAFPGNTKYVTATSDEDACNVAHATFGEWPWAVERAS